MAQLHYYSNNMEIINNAPLSEQSQEFQDYFNAEIAPNITFGNGIDSVQTCTEFDEFGRPWKWVFENVTIQAVYYTENENYSFNQFLICNVE